MTSQSFPEQLAHYQRSLGLSQPKLAKLLGVHANTVWNWRQGRWSPKDAPAVLETLSRALERETAKRSTLGRLRAEIARLEGGLALESTL